MPTPNSTTPSSTLPHPQPLRWSLLRVCALLGCGIWGVGSSVGCVRPDAAADADLVRVIVRASPTTFDPRVGTDEGSQRVHQLVYSQLMTIDAQLRVAPGLAARLDNPDPLTYIAHLRSGVKFHDGHDLTAKDVVYTFGSFLDPAFVSARKGAYRMLESVKALGDSRVEFKLKEPFGSFPVQLVMQVVPDGAGESLRSFPIGTGPYRFVRYVVDEQVELSAFEGYWDGLPQNAGVVLRIVPDDTMRGLELRKGSADLAVNDVSPDIAYQLQKDGLTITQGEGVDYTYIGLNMRDPVLRDKRVRHAIGYAIDRQAIVDFLRRGLARPAVGVLSPAAWAFEPDVHQFTFDLARAKRLLDEAGYRDPDGDGPLPRLTLSLKTSTDEFYRLQAAVIQQNLRLVGIDVDVRSYEFATFYADVLSGNVQMYTLQWVGVTDPDMLRRVFHSEQVPPIGFNRIYYSNPEVDRLIDQATTALTDEGRQRYYSQVQKAVAEDAPYISLWYKTNIAVARPDITGMRLSAQADFLALKDVRKGR
ncbi:MAG: ABC transporter substrate-binding protein [Acidobacteria bacterium]|nr:ABC transporter substrate-binding protein [Acidobacteriota bacterium]